MAMTEYDNPAPRSGSALLIGITISMFLFWQLGAHVDAWYHFHYGFQIESFFTWSHALLYGGWLGMGAVAAIYLLQTRRNLSTQPWLRPGYRVILLGTVLFGSAGLFDIVWHELFGFEARLENLLSPAHLALVVALGISVVGLLWIGSQWRRLGERSGGRLCLVDLPAIVALAIFLRHVTWSTMYSDPMMVDYGSGGNLTGHLHGTEGMGWTTMAGEAAGTSGVMLHTVIVVLFIMVAVRQMRLPVGTIAIMMLWSGTLTASITGMWLYVPAVAVGALVGEVICSAIAKGCMDGPDGRLGYWVLGCAVPLSQFTAYFALLVTLGGGSEWPVHLSVGTPLMAGIYGLVTALLVVPPSFMRPLGR